jgi:hypothetical protein
VRTADLRHRRHVTHKRQGIGKAEVGPSLPWLPIKLKWCPLRSRSYRRAFVRLAGGNLWQRYIARVFVNCRSTTVPDTSGVDASTPGLSVPSTPRCVPSTLKWCRSSIASSYQGSLEALDEHIVHPTTLLSMLTLITLDSISLVHSLLVKWLPWSVLKISGRRPPRNTLGKVRKHFQG